MIVFLSDFGQKNGYIAVVKGVIKNINPRVEIIDLSHHISPQNINEAAFVLWSSYKYFPKNTIFLSVIDPGVGSSRRIIILKIKKYIFVAPDNDILKYIISEEKKHKAYTVDIKRVSLKKASNTFHGRDVFAPLCAAISKGADIKKLGKKIQLDKIDYFIKVEKNNSMYEGRVIFIDHFGNCVTNLKLTSRIRGKIEIKKHRINGISKSYYNGKKGELIALVGSANLLEIAMNRGNVSKILRIKTGDKVRFYPE